jgi:hypothetical protein
VTNILRGITKDTDKRLENKTTQEGNYYSEFNIFLLFLELSLLARN